MELRSVFIQNLKKYRKAKKVSQMALAEKCETSPSYIGEIEIGKKFPSVEMIQKIADALDIAPYRLFMESCDLCAPALSVELRSRLIEKIQASVADIINGYNGQKQVTSA